MKLLLATENEHKRREFARLLPGHDVHMLPDGFELPPEDGETFEANAFGKARAAADLASSLGALAFADDSGIEASALGGAPGVRSARYAGEDASDAENLAKLIEQAPERSALRYVCAIALVEPATGEERVFFGYCSGTLTHATRGERGFGYDPAFVPDEQPRRGALGAEGEPDDGRPDEDGPDDGLRDGRPLTMAELSDAEKDAISHRGRAVAELLAWLAAR